MVEAIITLILAFCCVVMFIHELAYCTAKSLIKIHERKYHRENKS